MHAKRQAQDTLKTTASAEAIQLHYDVSNEFYRLWLDETLCYSCALWLDGEGIDDLHAAQKRKLDYHIREARAHAASRVLDIGCGWGGIMRRLVEVYDCPSVVGLTLAKEQYAWNCSVGVPGIEARLESWTDHVPTEPYDAIISVGAFEHFARPEHSDAQRIEGYRHFFDSCRKWLHAGRWISLQTVSYGSVPRELHPLIGTKIFPESDLPTLAQIEKAAEGMFEIARVRHDATHYVRTIKAWRTRITANRDAAVKLVGEEEVVRFLEYLGMFVIGLESEGCDLLRISLRRLDA